MDSNATTEVLASVEALASLDDSLQREIVRLERVKRGIESVRIAKVALGQNCRFVMECYRKTDNAIMCLSEARSCLY